MNMAKTAEEVLNGLLGTSLKVPAEQLSALKEADGSWKDDAPEALLRFDAERVTALNSAHEQKLSEQAGRLKREVLEEFESKVRDEFDLKDAKAKGIDLVKHVVQARTKALETIPEERIKSSPLYIALEEQVRKVPTELEAKLAEQKKALESEFTTKVLTREAIAKAKNIFRGMRPILPKNAEVAAAQETLLDNFIAGHKLQFVQNERGELIDIIPMKADGSGRLEDAHGHPVKYEDLIKQGAARYFEFEQGEPRNGSPNPNDVGGGGGNGGGGTGDASYDPKSEQEYADAHARIRREHSADPVERTKHLTALKAAAVKNGVIKA